MRVITLWLITVRDGCGGGVFSGITEYVYKKKSKTEFQSDVLINNGSSDIFVLH